MRTSFSANVLAVTFLVCVCNATQAHCQDNVDSREQTIEAVSLTGKQLRRRAFPPEVRMKLEQQLTAAQAKLAEDPDNVENLIWVARRLAYLWRYNEAVEMFSAGIRRFPEDARLYRHRGHRFITLRKFDQAIADLERAAQLIEGQADQVEPDGQPNAAGIPTSTLHTNIWYHLGLARYLQADFPAALRAYEKCLAAAANNDMRVATLDWMYMTLRRLERHKQAEEAIEGITEDMKLLENFAYHRRLLMYRGVLQPTDLVPAASDADRDMELATYGYGVGNWYLVNGDVDHARRIFQDVVRGSSWSAFGYIAAEAELARGDE